MKIYKTCRTISLFRFYEILDSKDYKYLIDDWENTKIDEKLQLELNKIWIELFKEYIVLKDDSEIKTSFKKLALIDKMKTKLAISSSLLNGYLSQSSKQEKKKYSDELKAWGFKINVNLPQQNQVDRLISSFKALKSTIEIKQIEWDKLFKKELTEEKINIDEQIVNVEDVLGGGKTIDSEKTMVSKWVFYVKKATMIAKKRNKRAA